MASNQYFWRFRHIFNKDIFNYSYGKTPKNYFKKVFQNIKIESILDYGCATGDKLNFFANNGTKFCYGIDINPQAIKTAKTKINKLNVYSEFSHKISLININNYLKKKNLKKFDLVIIERLFYILNNNNFYHAMEILAKKTKYIYIDDFF